MLKPEATSMHGLQEVTFMSVDEQSEMVIE